MSDPRDGRCPECGNPANSQHQDACSRVHSEDFVGVPRGTVGTPGVVHLFASEGSDTALCCGIRTAAIPHSEQATAIPMWATCPGREGSDVQLREGDVVKAADLPVGSRVGDNWVRWTKRSHDEWVSQHATVYNDRQVQLRLDDDATVLTLGEGA